MFGAVIAAMNLANRQNQAKSKVPMPRDDKAQRDLLNMMYNSKSDFSFDLDGFRKNFGCK